VAPRHARAPVRPPASRFWPIQWAETGIYLALALILAGFCYWRAGRRLP